MQTAFLFDRQRPEDAVGSAINSVSLDASSTTNPRDEADARRLEATGRFKILRQLVHRPVRSDAPPPDGLGIRIGVVVDVETTGLDPARAEVIEFAAVKFTYATDGIRDVVGEFEGLQQPSRPLSAEVSRLTGLTDADLEGCSIDLAALAAFVGPADLVVAHNAGFDRGFCEKLHPTFGTKAWACSASDVDWKLLGEPVAKLGTLLAAAGRFHGAHRALTDCHGVLEILAAPAWAGPNGAFAQLLAAAGTEIFEVRAEGSPYDARSVLKSAGYRWDPGAPGRPKAWCKIVPASKVSSEEFFCRHEVYRNARMPVVRRIAPGDRFR